MRLLVLPVLSVTLMAAAPLPQRALVMAVPIEPGLGQWQTPPRPAALPPSSFQPAPLPNRDVEAPLGERINAETRVAPSLVNRSDTYRGEGFSRGSTAAAAQDSRARPGAALNLKMPLTPN